MEKKFKVQIKDYVSRQRPFWRDMENFHRRFATEEAAWNYVGSLDQDGYIDRVNFRVVEEKKK